MYILLLKKDFHWHSGNNTYFPTLHKVFIYCFLSSCIIFSNEKSLITTIRAQFFFSVKLFLLLPLCLFILFHLLIIYFLFYYYYYYYYYLIFFPFSTLLIFNVISLLIFNVISLLLSFISSSRSRHEDVGQWPGTGLETSSLGCALPLTTHNHWEPWCRCILLLYTRPDDFPLTFT